MAGPNLRAFGIHLKKKMAVVLALSLTSKGNVRTTSS